MLGNFFEPKVESLFENTTISELMTNHCNPEDADKIKCKCIVTPVYNDLNMRFSKAEIQKLETDKRKMTNEMLKSLKNKNQEVKDCLGSKGEKGLEWIKKIGDLIKAVSS